MASGAALVLAGCTNSSDDSSGPSGTTAVTVDKVDSIAAELPDKIKSSGKLVIGVNLPYPPNEFKDGSGKLVGFDIDLMTAISQVLGVKADFSESAFETLIPSIQAGTFDLASSSVTDSKAREETVDFVTYFNAGTQWAHQAGKPVDPNDACGKKVAVQSTTVQETDELPAKSKACTDAGKPAIEILKFGGQDEATNALVIGRADAMSADSPVTGYAVKKTDGKLELAGEIFDSAPYGWPVAKGSPLGPVLQKALQHLIDNGAYKQIAANWAGEAGMIEKPVINGATS